MVVVFVIRVFIKIGLFNWNDMIIVFLFVVNKNKDNVKVVIVFFNI